MSAGEYWEEDDGTLPRDAEEGPWLPAAGSGDRSHASLALGLIALVPLFVAYEFGLSSDPELHRTLSERALFRLLAPLGEWQTALRQLILAVAVSIALVLCFRRRLALGPSLLRLFGEGFLGAIVLGPTLALGIRLLGGFDAGVSAAVGDSSLPIAGRVLGGAAFEELLFRVGVYSVLYLLTRHVVSFFGATERWARWCAEPVAVLGSALGFAGIHLAAYSSWLGPGGEVWDSEIFIWRSLAGVFLALVFRWRGLGVAAWSHALFNLSVLIGAGPEVLL